MYSQRHTSQMTMSSGNAFFRARTAFGTMPFGAQAPLAFSSFLSGMPNRITAGTPSFRRPPGFFHEFVHGQLELSGHGTDGFPKACAFTDEQRHHQVADGQLGFADERAEFCGLAEPARAIDREAHGSGPGDGRFDLVDQRDDVVGLLRRHEPRAEAAVIDQPGQAREQSQVLAHIGAQSRKKWYTGLPSSAPKSTPLLCRP